MYKFIQLKKMKFSLPILVVLLLLTFIPRLYRIHYPLMDWHSFRQADTASVTREYVLHGINLLEPKYHDVSNIASGLPNPEGYRMVEFPWQNAITAVILQFIPQLPLVPTSRMVSILLSLITVGSLYYLVRLYSNNATAVLAGLFFALLPYSIFYGRAILPEAGMQAMSLLAIASFAYWTHTKRWQLWLLAWIGLTLAFLSKPFVLFLGPVFLAISWLSFGKNIWKEWPILLLGTSLLPMLAWREWITNFPSGIPANVWLYNSNNIRWQPAWWRWLVFERYGKLITGLVGWLLSPLAFLPPFTKANWILLSWWVGIFAYLSIIATGNVQHDYYQVLLIAPTCWTLAVGTINLHKILAKTNNKLAIFMISSLLITGWLVAWQHVAGYFNVNHWEYKEAGEAVAATTPTDALVIAPAFGDTIFLFQTQRRGWPIGFEIEDKIAAGAQYYVSVDDDDERRNLAAKYEVVVKHDKYLIIDLTRPIEAE